MQRGLRIGWIVAANGAVVLFTAVRLLPEMSTPDAWITPAILQVTLEILLEILLPIAGIIAEIANRKYSPRLNIGYLALATCWWLFAAAISHSNPFGGLVLAFAVAFFILTGITALVYRATKLD